MTRAERSVQRGAPVAAPPGEVAKAADQLALNVALQEIAEATMPAQYYDTAPRVRCTPKLAA